MKKIYDKYSAPDPIDNNDTDYFCKSNEKETYSSSYKQQKLYDVWIPSDSTKDDCNCFNTCVDINKNNDCNKSSTYNCTNDETYNYNSNETCNCNNKIYCNETCDYCDDKSSCNEICNYYNLYNYKFNNEHISINEGKSSEFTLSKNDCEVRVDITICNCQGTMIWGEVRDHNCNPMPKVLVTLLKGQCIHGVYEYIKIQCTLTDCLGHYQFFIPENECLANYKITLGKTIC
ncbi:hypothetical protein DVW12_17110 [Clostridium botulinum]|nr:hypothetical protein [Clostridium botulinum]